MAQYNGWTKVNVSSYDAFRSAVLGNGYNVDYAYGDQCYDGVAVQLFSATGRKLSTGGTGGARGCWEVTSARNYNAGSEYELIWDKTQIKRGDMVVWSMNSKWGHIGFADQDYNGNYLKTLGQNQVGDGSGYPFTIANLSLATFLGAFRYKNWKVVEPTPAPSGGSDIKKKVIVPTGITIAALAAALGLTVPQLLAGDPNDPGDDIVNVDPNQKLDDDEAKKAAENAEKAKEAQEGKTIDQMAQDRCAEGNKECVEVETVKWNGRNDGTIWNMCVNHSRLSPEECTAKAIEINNERLQINAAKRNVIQEGGHWIFPGDVYTIPVE